MDISLRQIVFAFDKFQHRHLSGLIPRPMRPPRRKLVGVLHIRLLPEARVGSSRGRRAHHTRMRKKRRETAGPSEVGQSRFVSAKNGAEKCQQKCQQTPL